MGQKVFHSYGVHGTPLPHGLDHRLARQMLQYLPYHGEAAAKSRRFVLTVMCMMVPNQRDRTENADSTTRH